MMVLGAVGGQPIAVAIVSGGGTGGTASDFNQTMPGVGTAAGFKDPSGKMAPGNLDASGNLIVSGTFGGGISSAQRQHFVATVAASGTTTFTCTAIPGGKTGHLLKVHVVSNGQCWCQINNSGGILGELLTNFSQADYEPPTEDFDLAAATTSFTVVVTNLGPSATIACTVYWDNK